VKVPATEPEIPAIEQLTAEGISVNVILIFSLGRYREVSDSRSGTDVNRARRKAPGGARGFASVPQGHRSLQLCGAGCPMWHGLGMRGERGLDGRAWQA
jgi:hypothetical protein